MAKINISIDDQLLNTIDEVADESYISRSGLISLALVQYVNQSKVVNALDNMSKAFTVIAQKNVVDAETLQKLSELETLCRVLNAK